MAVGEDKAITVRPGGVSPGRGGVMVPEDLGDLRHPEGHPGVTGIGLCTASMAKARMALVRFVNAGFSKSLYRLIALCPPSGTTDPPRPLPGPALPGKRRHSIAKSAPCAR